MELNERLVSAYQKGFTSFWATELKEAEEFAKNLGWKISFVMISAIDAELYFVYKDKKCLPENIQEEISLPLKRITKDRFLNLKENICILDEMTHGGHEYYTTIIDEPELSESINRLGEAVREFEKDTQLTISIH